MGDSSRTQVVTVVKVVNDTTDSAGVLAEKSVIVCTAMMLGDSIRRVPTRVPSLL